MYCEASLSMAKAASGDAPDYLRNRRRPFPWWILYVIVIAAGAYVAYRYQVIPFLPQGKLLKETSFNGTTSAESIFVEQDATVIIHADWFRGDGSIKIQESASGKVVSEIKGPTPLALTATIPRGNYQVFLQVGEGPGKLEIRRK
jgi:hypothetical protein